MSTLAIDTIQGATSAGIVTMPTGSIVQMGGDTWAPAATNNITTTGVATGLWADYLQVAITFRSTSNKFWVQIHMPDGYNNGVATRCIDGIYIFY